MMRSLIWLLASLIATGGTVRAEPGVEDSAWALATVADCEGPDGGTFVTSVVSLPGGTIRFEQVHPDGTVALLLVAGETEQIHRRVDGTGAEWEVLPAVQAEFVRGHDVHRRFLESGSAGALESEIPEAIGGGTVRLEFGDLRPVVDTELPYQVDFLHDGERYRYRFRSVLPFRVLAGGELPASPAGLYERLGDLQEILQAHERVLRAHLDSDVEALIADQAADGVSSGRGRLTGSTPEETAASLGPYLDRTRFTRYEDVVAPIVSVSRDGSLGWLACEIEAEGQQVGDDGTSEPIRFGFSWVEMYRLREGRWEREGNASSARP